MNTLKSSVLDGLPWVGTTVFGIATGFAAWWLTFRARSFCAVGFEAGGRFGLMFLLPVAVAGGGLAAGGALFLGRLLTSRAPTVLRVVVPVLLILTVTVLPGWWLVAHIGTPSGLPGHPEGVPGFPPPCPRSNVPPSWPGWLPV